MDERARGRDKGASRKGGIMKAVIDRMGRFSSFPKLMESNDGRIVLMLEATGKGVRIDNKEDNLGDYAGFDESDKWSMEEFEDFEGSITLSNE
jgi:hypothetical protein